VAFSKPWSCDPGGKTPGGPGGFLTSNTLNILEDTVNT
jgi:hypothetical protein